jgi:hypothetical protein
VIFDSKQILLRRPLVARDPPGAPNRPGGFFNALDGARDPLGVLQTMVAGLGLHSAEQRQAEYRPERALVILAASPANPVTGRRNRLGQ